MGWKAACIVAIRKGAHPLCEIPNHDTELARRLVEALPLPPHRSDKPTTFEVGIHPDRLTVGAYDGAVIIGHHELTASCFMGTVPPVIHAINSVIPGAQSLAMSLHSVVNHYGYAYFDGLTLMRARAGSADDGIVIDVGEWLPEERPLYANSEMRGGERIFFHEIDGRVDEYDHSAFGEEFVFELARRVMGKRIDEGEELDALPMETFVPVHRGLFRRLFGR